MMTNSMKQARESNNLSVARAVNEKPCVVRAIPNTLTIEPGTVCPLQCVFCPQINPDFDLPRNFLSFPAFQRITNNFSNSLERINLFNWGEPLLNPDISKMVSYASARGITSVVHSNVNSLTSQMAEALVAGGLSELTASIDGASEESYKRYRARGSFSAAMSNLKLLIDAKRKSGRSNPRIVWQFLVFRHNEHEIPRAKEMAVDLGVEIKFRFAVVIKREFESTLADYNGTEFRKKFIRDYGSPCDALWKNPVIHSDGTVLPCCQIFEKKYALGNLFEEDFSSIWNNKKYQELRNVVAGRTQADESSFCYRCIFNPKKGDARYHEIQVP